MMMTTSMKKNYIKTCDNNIIHYYHFHWLFPIRYEEECVFGIKANQIPHMGFRSAVPTAMLFELLARAFTAVAVF